MGRDEPTGEEAPGWAVLLGGDGHPDLGVVDVVARLLLVARRRGWRLELRPPAGALAELLELAGLRLEVQRQPELGEEALGLQEGEEERHLGDPPA
jgi:hypothetical protein